jgi:hypothetical protein
MAKPFNELRERLLSGGVAPRHVRRYLAELADHLADLRTEEERAGRSRADAESAALLRLGGIDELASAMIEKRNLQSWSARAPWAIFGLGPLFFMALSYFIACFILWSGWRIFLPGTSTPFVRIDGLAIIYFGIGRVLYFGAPIFAGWAIALIAARQRFGAAWPMAGLVLIALIGPTARVHATHSAVSGGVGHVSMGFSIVPTVQGVSQALIYALVIISLSVVPYLIWRLGKGHILSA